ncbi:post-PEP-CTERM-1 domain-containing protein [Roseateles chitosanitabidus]|jgi:hypothetical protein|uniref:post-PEP-CTERM-1 domain-containing protein n=1 Tax=Roseateles chitosanitabidus TaxID=65048 RepID=UPI00082D7B5B|nr:hypothetical protein [Roseateles chitosanitabidus]MBO9687884.1 hypothetical protein [Roseateles chitosanitabidus]
MITRITLGLAVAMALPMAAQAQDAGVLPVGAAETAPTEALVVVRDTVTGKLRPATADEHAALAALPVNAKMRVAGRAAAITPQRKLHSSGAVGVRVTEDMMSHSVMVRGADGKLEEVCFSSKEEAEAFVKSGATIAKATLPTE